MAECDRLRAELASAEERIATLEKACSEAADRVAWVIDSLHSLTEEERTS